MGIGRIKKVFPGGNTSKGFFSFYAYIIDNQEASRIFVIKGGPGVGKSTFMRKIAEAMLERGYDVEFHCCSSDNGSLDGVVIPTIKVALLDGTAPHVVDPRNPGAVDEIMQPLWILSTIQPTRPQAVRQCIGQASPKGKLRVR